MSDLTPLLAAANNEPPTETFAVFNSRGYNTTSSSSEVEVLNIVKIEDEGTPVWEFMSQVPTGHFLGAEGYSNGGGAVTSTTASTRANFYITGLYPAYSEQADPILDENGDVNYLSGKDLIALCSYDFDSIHLVDISDPANPTIPVRSDGTHPSKYASGTYLNNSYASTFLHGSTKLPNGNPNPYGPAIIAREGSNGGNRVGHFRYLLSSVPFNYTYELNTGYNEPVPYDWQNGIWVNGDHPIATTTSYLDDTMAFPYITSAAVTGSTVHGVQGYEISDIVATNIPYDTAIMEGARSFDVAYYEDTGYTGNGGQSAHIVLTCGVSFGMYYTLVPATGIVDAADFQTKFNALNTHTPEAWNANCWTSHPNLQAAGLPGSSTATGSSIDVVGLKFDKNIKVHEDSFGTAVVGFYYAANFPSSSRREFWVMTLDIRAPSSNLSSTVGANYNGISPIYDVIDCMNVTDYMWNNTTVGGSYTGNTTTVYLNRTAYDTASRLFCMSAAVSSTTYFPILSTSTAANRAPLMAFFKIADDGTISHHDIDLGQGWAKEYYDNQGSTGYTIPSAQQINYSTGATSYGIRIYTRPKE